MTQVPPRWLIAVLLLAFTVIAAGVILTFGVGLTTPADSSKDASKRPVAVSMHSGPSLPDRISELKPEDSPFRFESMTEQSGIDVVYYGSPTRDANMTEQNGGGVALLDYDRDGRLDLFFTNGSSFRKPASGLAESNRMYRSVGDFRYEDVTEAAGLVAHGFGMGVAAGDYDNDGFTDQFVACYGRDRLWRNNGDGTFTEVTETAGVGSERWGTSAAMADLDGDGLLDLYVVNYVDWSPSEPPCHPADHPEINNVCSPTDHSGQPDALYRNRGEGHFDEIGVEAGVSREDGKGLALTIADLDRDGRLDIYVVNDTVPKYLFRNLGGMRFEEIAAPTGAAIGSDGTIGSGMGVACADIDHNGRLDLCVTNFRHQVNDVYANMDHGGFEAVNAKLGVDLCSRAPLGFGIVFADFNLDTWSDMFVANGHIWDLTSIGGDHEFQMHPQLLWNQRGGRFTDASATAGDYFQHRWLGRSVAYGDLDNDGDADLVVTHLGSPPAVLRNDCVRTNDSVRLELIGIRSVRQPLGARIEIVSEKQNLMLHVPSGGSFQASHDPRVLAAVPGEISEIRVWWPGGNLEVWNKPVADHQGDLRLIEGSGQRLVSGSAPESVP